MNCRPKRLMSASAAVGARTKARGATLLEAIAFLGISAIVIAGALAMFGTSYRSASADRFVEEANVIAANVRGLYSSPGTGGYASLSMVDLNNAQAFPGTLQIQNGGGTVTVTDIWGGAVTVTLGANNVPVLTYANVPKAVCVQALVASGNWLSVSVNNAAQPSATLSAAQAATACANAANTIAWGFS